MAGQWFNQVSGNVMVKPENNRCLWWEQRSGEEDKHHCFT